MLTLLIFNEVCCLDCAINSETSAEIINNRLSSIDIAVGICRVCMAGRERDKVLMKAIEDYNVRALVIECSKYSREIAL